MTLGQASQGGNIQVDLPCGRCGYNLRTLSFDGRCPECGAVVAETADPQWLRINNRWLARFYDALDAYFWCTIIFLVILSPVILISGMMWLMLHTVSTIVLTTKPAGVTITGSGLRWVPRIALLALLLLAIAVVITREPWLLIGTVPLLLLSMAGLDAWLNCLAREWYWPAVRRAGPIAIMINGLAALTVLAIPPAIMLSRRPSAEIAMAIMLLAFVFAALISHLVVIRKALVLLRRTRILWDPNESVLVTPQDSALPGGDNKISGEPLVEKRS